MTFMIRLGPKIWFLACLGWFSSFAIADQNTIEAIQIQRQGLINLIQHMDQSPKIFDKFNNSQVMLSRDQKNDVLTIWALYLDYMSTLHQLADATKSYLLLGAGERQTLKQIHALAFTAHYRFGLEFISRVQTDSELVKWLNTEHEDLNLPKNFYRRFRNQLLSDWATDAFDEFSAAFKVTSTDMLGAELNEDRAAIRNIHRTQLLAANSADYIKRSLYRTWFPLQKGVAKGMGKVKVWRIGETLITPEQAYWFSEQFAPGDFFITRKEWRLTNVGIPGYWTHSALYIGTPEERADYFDTPEIKAWLTELGARNFEHLLRRTSADYARHVGYDVNGDVRVIEALDAGVIFNSIETSLSADAAAVFRPLVSKLDKAKAIYNAFFYTGRPYDFHFDFDSDDALVCSELIVKAYQANSDKAGIPFPLYRFAGKRMLTPNEIARWFDDTLNTPQQALDLVMFIDSNELEGVAFQAHPSDFTDSWRRPDWHIFKQQKRLPNWVATQSKR